ncbi:MAG: hypothetical protein AAF492_16315, partial [Verrucomicrobiota bacterium]
MVFGVRYQVLHDKDETPGSLWQMKDEIRIAIGAIKQRLEFLSIIFFIRLNLAFRLVQRGIAGAGGFLIRKMKKN